MVAMTEKPKTRADQCLQLESWRGRREMVIGIVDRWKLGGKPLTFARRKFLQAVSRGDGGLSVHPDLRHPSLCRAVELELEWQSGSLDRASGACARCDGRQLTRPRRHLGRQLGGPDQPAQGDRPTEVRCGRRETPQSRNKHHTPCHCEITERGIHNVLVFCRRQEGRAPGMTSLALAGTLGGPRF